MKLFAENLNILWGELVVEELCRNGVNFFCISPGSRSTLLTTAVARNSKANSRIFYDERGAAFYALGYAHATGNPAVLICTSGTALANYYPAVVEAYNDQIPLIILSADRPPELRDTGANQAIIQQNMFGQYVNWFFDLPCPDEVVKPSVVLSTIDQAIIRAKNSPAAAVQINMQFREPLAPQREFYSDQYLPSIERWINSDEPFTKYHEIVEPEYPEALNELMESLLPRNDVLVVVGRLKNESERTKVSELCQHLDWPVYADVLSGVRSENQPVFWDLMFLSDKLIEQYNFKNIIHLGGQMTGKRWLQFLEKVNPEKYIKISDHNLRKDPTHQITHHFQVSVERFCTDLIFRMRVRFNPAMGQQDSLNEKIDAILKSETEDIPQLNEPGIARQILRNLPRENVLFLASSMPVRVFDMYPSPWDGSRTIAANRGASGIDGTIASAIGYAEALQQPLTLCIGDLAMLHDLNSLMLLPDTGVPVTIVLFNNGGGGIFHFLPVHNFPEIFEKYFATPHQFIFRYVAKMFRLDYIVPQTMNDFAKIYGDAMQSNNHTLIEISLSRDENLRLQKQIQSRIRKELDQIK